MRVVSIINHKGGVGKTTLTANLGAGLAARGKKVLLVDLDAQGSLTVSFFTQNEWMDELSETRTIKHWFDGIEVGKELDSLESLITCPPRVFEKLSYYGGHLDLIPAHGELADVETALTAYVRDDPAGYPLMHRRLRDGLTDEALGEYDIALIDCAPNFGLMAKNAVAASDLLLIPTRPDYLSTNGIDSLGLQIKTFAEAYNERRGDSDPIERPPASVIFTMVQLHDDRPIESQRSFISRVEALGIPTFGTMIRDSKAVYGPAPEHGVPVILGGTGRAQTRELRNVVSEFVTLLEEVAG
ncbi:ParA family protein [Pseudonocardia nigra]|uniref:ParA family protein n=1 Tax=Pseudonocardia nigra TaxID=1921578 RepID=UPI001C5D1F58|nr:ParA family protein [Pseudonocardia nigra]